MVYYRRILTDNPEEIFFLTLVTHQRELVFNEDKDFVHLSEAMHLMSVKASSTIVAYTCLPDHLHILLHQGAEPYSKQISWFKRRVNWHHTRNQGTVWQNRFWEHKIRDEDDFFNHLHYIHMNPVKHGWIRHPIGWPWSSFNKYVALGLYQKDWILEEDVVLPWSSGE